MRNVHKGSGINEPLVSKLVSSLKRKMYVPRGSFEELRPALTSRSLVCFMTKTKGENFQLPVPTAVVYVSPTIINSPSRSKSSNKLFFLNLPLLILSLQQKTNTRIYAIQADLELKLLLPPYTNAGTEGSALELDLVND